MAPAKRLDVGDGSFYLLDLSTLTHEEKDALGSFDRLLEAIRTKEAGLADRLAPLSILCNDIHHAAAASSSHDPSDTPPLPSIAASSLKCIESAVDAVGLSYVEDDIDCHWEFNEIELLGDRDISAHADVTLRDIRKSKYFQLAENSRTVLDIILCDRAKFVQERTSEKIGNWFFDVPMSIPSELYPMMIKGEADVCLSNSQSALESSLVVVQSSRNHGARAALPQLIVYLAAVHKHCQQYSTERGPDVFGISTDTREFRFAHLSPTGQLRVSSCFDWPQRRAQIVKWIDGILHYPA